MGMGLLLPRTVPVHEAAAGSHTRHPGTTESGMPEPEPIKPLSPEHQPQNLQLPSLSRYLS